MSVLPWPDERAGKPHPAAHFSHVNSNLCLDFHGDPSKAGVSVLSDGNHHMALEEALTRFVLQHPEVGEVFYSTTPARVMAEIALAGAACIGNLQFTIQPDIFIGPPGVLKRLLDEKLMQPYAPFVRSLGNVLLVKKGNPKKIYHVTDLVRDEVRLFLSNPETESVSYQMYHESLIDLAQRRNIELKFLDHPAGQPDPRKLVYGERIHHREAPQALADDVADAALIHYHLALRYQRIFPELFDWVWPDGAFDNGGCEHSQFHCGMSVQVGEWGKALYQHLMSAEVAAIYQHHGLETLVAI